MSDAPPSCLKMEVLICLLLFAFVCFHCLICFFCVHALSLSD